MYPLNGAPLPQKHHGNVRRSILVTLSPCLWTTQLQHGIITWETSPSLDGMPHIQHKIMSQYHLFTMAIKWGWPRFTAQTWGNEFQFIQLHPSTALNDLHSLYDPIPWKNNFRERSKCLKILSHILLQLPRFHRAMGRTGLKFKMQT